MAEDAVNEEELEYTFTAYEIDLDYEFDAARFFDFERDESLPETRLAELWFDSAGSYPPSPFVEKLVPREEVLKENVNISPKSKGVESMNLSEGNSDIEAELEISAMEMNYGDEGQEHKGISSTIRIASQQKFQNGSHKLLSGLTFYNHMANNVKAENQTKLSMKKPKVPRASTLMKPTASILAKQNRPFQAGYSRSQTSLFEKTSKNSANTCVIENQAAKRQKLEGGLLKKVMGTVQLQQTNFVHKAPKQDGFLDSNLTNTKLRITIPKDPDLETAHRALRAKSSKDNATSTVRRFKALPLNRKILEAPSLLPKRSTPRLPDFQEFQLKTSERAMQHSSAVLKSTVPCNHSDKDLHKYRSNLTMDCGNREPGRPIALNNASKPDGCLTAQSFKALPLNKKIFTSKGDIGMFRNIKKETTVPMEFNFHREKRFHDNPPVELFNKLSLVSETQVSNSETKVPQSISISTKRIDGVVSSQEMR
ncbi:hypothetical protein ACS0TY_004479 [Phlomoides rotata]